METSAQRLDEDTDRGAAGIDPARWRAASGFVQQLVKTIKTCRLYDGENPTVIKFREELARQLQGLTQAFGPFRITFSSDDVCWEERSLYPARSRDDNLAQPFFRDGIRALTFHPEIKGLEVEAFLDQILAVTGPRAADEDLVTLLWSASLPHIDVDYVSVDGDVDMPGTVDREDLAKQIPPWPSADKTVPPQALSQIPARPVEGETAESGRSDDWETREGTADPAKMFGMLELRQSVEADRFKWELQANLELSHIRSALDLIQVCLRTEGSPDSRDDLARFTPRVLREAILQGEWDKAVEALELLETIGGNEWSVGALVRELLGPYSVVTPKAVLRLDRQDEGGIDGFLAFAGTMGTEGVEWLMTVLAESQQKRVRRPLTKVIAGLCAESPEQLDPWLEDSRWYVVRNVVHILGWIGGGRIIPLLEKVENHPEPRVRIEVVATLAQADRDTAREMLLRMLGGASSRLFGAILHQLSQEQDAQVASRLVDCMSSPGFAERPAEDSRAFFIALGSCGGEEILPALAVTLNKGPWLSLKPDEQRRASARCLARLGTPEALEVLRRGSRSPRPAVRKACREALNGTGCDE